MSAAEKWHFVTGADYLAEIGANLALADLYEGIDFEAEAAALRVMEEEAAYAS